MKNWAMIISNNIFKIFIAILAVIVVIIIILSITSSLSSKQNTTQGNPSYTIPISNTIEKPEDSVITGQTLTQEQSDTNIKVINTFIQYCNQNNTQAAYDMLSDLCKEKLYPTLDTFYHNYYKLVFTTQRVCSTQSWITVVPIYTYKVRLSPDILSQGNYEAGSTYEDYYTVIGTQEGYKLNINRYICSYVVGKEQESNNIKSTITTKDVYRDYSIYNVKIENNTGKTIKVDSRRKADSIYALDSKGNKIASFAYELFNSKLIVDNQYYRNISIKFNENYTGNTSITNIVFSDVVLDYEQYTNAQNKEQYTNTAIISLPV